MKNTNPGFRHLLLSVCGALAISACATSDDVDFLRGLCREDSAVTDPGCGERNPRDTPEWKESATVFPPLPRATDLRPIDAFEASEAYEYLVDRASIVRGTDGVMRYTVVVRAATGKSSIFHEGIRCATSEARSYGYVTSAGEFRASSSAHWKPLASSGVRGYQAYLANVVMCDRDGYDWDARKAVAALDASRTGGCLNAQNCTGYYKRNE